ncbi:hypothetical protein SAMN05216404_106197 [Nitrosospira multiformis]|uniref:Uncharacterized protein n=1 Tax=Nitrosospira multiformis TaxID=1231 RepID=A0A1H8IWH9_9PROT|nr:hypothetical protein [Nitrosospira multiformis]SEN72505.1 hypothetical protein SAMN05216404_106197 [Nitrosospira multiformis]
MNKHPVADGFQKKNVVMKKGIPVFEGYAATGRIGDVQFSIVCPNRQSCDEIWGLLEMNEGLDHNNVPKVVLCRASDIEMDVTAVALRETGK